MLQACTKTVSTENIEKWRFKQEATGGVRMEMDSNYLVHKKVFIERLVHFIEKTLVCVCV